LSKASRSKGKRGEAEARNTLTDRDWIILANTADGSEVEDIIARSPEGKVYSIEVKNTKQIDVPKVLAQARNNAGKKKIDWMVMCKITQSRAWLVWAKGEQPKVWVA
jgi:Holliday junction resolvase-like predicted endonuclease